MPDIAPSFVSANGTLPLRRKMVGVWWKKLRASPEPKIGRAQSGEPYERGSLTQKPAGALEAGLTSELALAKANNRRDIKQASKVPQGGASSLVSRSRFSPNTSETTKDQSGC